MTRRIIFLLLGLATIAALPAIINWAAGHPILPIAAGLIALLLFNLELTPPRPDLPVAGPPRSVHPARTPRVEGPRPVGRDQSRDASTRRGS